MIKISLPSKRILHSLGPHSELDLCGTVVEERTLLGRISDFFFLIENRSMFIPPRTKRCFDTSACLKKKWYK